MGGSSDAIKSTGFRGASATEEKKNQPHRF